MIEKLDWPGVAQTASEILKQCPLDQDLAGMLLEQYHRMGSPIVALRSSATCEDQEGVSAAGQYETYLNIQGAEDLLLAVASFVPVECISGKKPLRLNPAS